MRLFRIKRVAVTLSAWGVLALYIRSVPAQSPPSSGSPAQRPNIVLILTDDLDSRSQRRSRTICPSFITRTGCRRAETSCSGSLRTAMMSAM